MSIVVTESLGQQVKKRIASVYLILAIDPTCKTETRKFITIKYDETVNGAKFVGIDTTKALAEIIDNYNDIIAKSDKHSFREILVPWSHVIRVEQLTYQPVK